MTEVTPPTPTLYTDKEVDSKLPHLYINLVKCPVTVVTFVPHNTQHVQHNPLKILPCYVENEVCVWGTLPVLSYLMEKYSPNNNNNNNNNTQQLYGTPLKERCEVNSMLYWCAGALSRAVLNNYVYPQTKQSYSLPGEENVKLLQLGHQGVTQQLDNIEQHHLKPPRGGDGGDNYMCGCGENVVDYYIAVVLMELSGVGFDFSKWCRLKTWFDVMQGKVKELLAAT